MRFRRVLLLVLALCCSGCRKTDRAADAPHPRMVCLSPALTKIVFDMGLARHVVGVSSCCQLPPGQSRTVVGNARGPFVEPTLAVKPDVLLAQMELKNIQALRGTAPALRVEHFTLERLDDIASAMERIGRIAGRADLGLQSSRDFRRKLDRVRQRTAGLPRRDAMFVMGFEKPLAAGRDTFIDEMITLAGGVNVLAECFSHWQNPDIESILKHPPRVILCQCRPGEEAQATEYWLRLFRKTSARPPRVFVVTQADWTIPAGHLADYTQRLAKMIHPELETGE